MPFLLAFVPLCGYVCVGLGLLASWVGRIPVKRLCTWHTDGFTLTLAFYPNLLTHRSSVYLIRAGCKPCSSERAGNCPTWHTKASPSSSGHQRRPSELGFNPIGEGTIFLQSLFPFPYRGRSAMVMVAAEVDYGCFLVCGLVQKLRRLKRGEVSPKSTVHTYFENENLRGVGVGFWDDQKWVYVVYEQRQRPTMMELGKVTSG